jgi:hypothetical protein
MTRTLDPPYGPSRTLTATTTAKLARRMLGASAVVAEYLPSGLYSSPGFDILLALHVAEEDAQYLDVRHLTPPGSPGPAVTRRWISVLAQEGLIDRKGDVLALSTRGHDIVTDLLGKLYAVQRALD